MFTFLLMSHITFVVNLYSDLPSCAYCDLTCDIVGLGLMIAIDRDLLIYDISLNLWVRL